MRLLKLNSEKVTWIVTCPKGAEELLANELSSLSATEISSSVGFVRADGGTQLGYKICLWSRLASRVLFPIHRFKETNAEEMYLEIRDIPWRIILKLVQPFVLISMVNQKAYKTHFLVLKRLKMQL